MAGFRLTPLAEEDLTELMDYVVVSSGTERAQTLLTRIVSSFDQLASAPEIGHVRRELAPDEVRFGQSTAT